MSQSQKQLKSLYLSDQKFEETNQKLQKVNVKIKQLEKTTNKYKKQENERRCYRSIIDEIHSS